MLTVTSISLICILCCGLVSALNPDEASISLSWSSQTVYQGDMVSITISLKSNSTDYLRIYNIGLYFDWMPPDSFSGLDFSANPVTIPSYGTYIFDAIFIQIPSNASVGSHSYFVGIDGTQGSSSSGFSWDSSTSMIQIHPYTAKIYAVFISQVESKLNEAISANYEGAKAQLLLQQAKTEYNLAQSLANEEKWEEAILSLENASNYLEQANAAEEGSDEQKEGQQSWLIYLVIIVIVVIIAVFIIVVVVRKRRKQTDSVAEQSLETIEEQS
jgi:hypothetical protein